MTDVTSTHRLLFCTAALLDQGRIVDRLSRPLTAAAFIVMMIWVIDGEQAARPLVAMTLPVGLAGLAEMYFAARVGFDAALFHRLAGGQDEAGFAGIDAALARLGVIKSNTGDRPAEARVAGARRLLHLQVSALAVQVLWIVAGAAFALVWL